jgi:hypothetical protein
MKPSLKIVITALIWASVIIACSKILGDTYEQIQYILITGAMANMLLLPMKSKKHLNVKVILHVQWRIDDYFTL